MSNETRTGSPLTATVGERLEDQARAGDTTGVDRAAAAVEDLRAGGFEAARGAPGRPGTARRADRRPASRDARPAIAWGLAAGLGAWVVAGMIGRVFRR